MSCASQRASQVSMQLPYRQVLCQTPQTLLVIRKIFCLAGCDLVFGNLQDILTNFTGRFQTRARRQHHVSSNLVSMLALPLPLSDDPNSSAQVCTSQSTKHYEFDQERKRFSNYRGNRLLKGPVTSYLVCTYVICIAKLTTSVFLSSLIR